MSSSQSEIIEGFICPICKADLKSPDQLTSHFESLHSDPDVLKSLKDIFGKAKKKILNIDERDLRETFDKALKLVPEENARFFEEQTLGSTRSHSDYYKAVRSAKQEKYAAETNKLLIRLDKLVANMPSDQSLRKNYEQEIVPWLDGSSVSLCPGCTKPFNLTRRQHHCRLCGAVLCNGCSCFFDLNIARRMIDPSLNANLLQVNTDPIKNGLRLCEHCYKLIELRKQLQDSRNSKTILVTGYEQMRSLMEQTSPAIAMYSKMCNSLKEGETTYHLSDISLLKGKIAKYAEGIDSLSKQIIALQIAPAGSQTTQLQKAIRQAAAYFIKEEIVNLPPVPTENEIKEIRRINTENAEKRIKMERSRMENNLTRRQYLENQSSTSRTSNPETWNVVNNDSAMEQVDAELLVEQMSRIREYIKQAREELKFEEVSILERNLYELKQEYAKKNSQ